MDIKISYRKNMRNITMRIVENKIIVNSSYNFSEDFILKWVEENKEKLLSKRKFIKAIDIEQKYYFLFGKQYFYKEFSNNKKNYLLSNGKLLEVKNFQIKSIEEALEKELFSFLDIRTKEIENIMNSPVQHKVLIKKLKCSWGNNQNLTKIITYSSNLFAYSKEKIDSVIIHEVAHRFEMNHSLNFWAIVFRYCSNYKQLKKSLDKGEYE